jgi:hypothetical protein
MTYSFLPARQPSKVTAGRFVFPGPRDRTTVNGMTGSGKSTFALWLFAVSADFDKKPWIVLDFKGEDLIQTALSEGIFEPLKIDAKLPKKPGIYVVRHYARDGAAPVLEFLWSIYDQGRIGLFVDEATMVPEVRGEANSGGPFQSILSQGRSKQIPVYTLAQRPVNVNRMIYSESNYHSVFRLKNDDDWDTVLKNIPKHSKNYEQVWNPDLELDKYWSRWYDEERNISFKLRPCPPPENILDTLAKRIDSMGEHERI